MHISTQKEVDVRNISQKLAYIVIYHLIARLLFGLQQFAQVYLFTGAYRRVFTLLCSPEIQ